MTNQTVLVDILSRAKESGLISPKKAHDSFNYDDDEEQNAEDFKMVEDSEKNKQMGQGYFNDKDYFNDGDGNEVEDNNGGDLIA